MRAPLLHNGHPMAVHCVNWTRTSPGSDLYHTDIWSIMSVDHCEGLSLEYPGGEGRYNNAEFILTCSVYWETARNFMMFFCIYDRP